MRKLIFALLLTSQFALAQANKTVRLSDYPGDTIQEKITAAEAGCSPSYTCTIVLEAFLPKMPEEVLTPPCNGCTRIDNRVVFPRPFGTTAGTIAEGNDARFSEGSIPSGLILFIDTGTCPTGWTESAALSGKTVIGTLAANGDVGTTGGSDSITPTVNSLTAAAQTFTGSSTTVPALAVGTLAFTGTPFSSVINHTHTVTGYTDVASATTGSASTHYQILSKTTDNSSTQSDFAPATGNPSGGVASITPAGTLSGSTATGTLTPLGSNGTSAVTGTLNSFDNRSAYVKLIACKKD